MKVNSPPDCQNAYYLRCDTHFNTLIFVEFDFVFNTTFQNISSHFILLFRFLWTIKLYLQYNLICVLSSSDINIYSILFLHPLRVMSWIFFLLCLLLILTRYMSNDVLGNTFDLKNASVCKGFFVQLAAILVNLSSMLSLTSFQHLFLKNLWISTTFHKIWVM